MTDEPQPALPTGTITFLFTDIEGSTPLWERETTVAQLLAELGEGEAGNSSPQ